MATCIRRPLVFSCVCLAFGVSASAADSKPKNIIFIVVDDLRCSLGCYGDPEVKSPNIDRLAAKGMRFDRAYCQYPVCNPSRSSFLTGWRPDKTGIYENKDPVRAKFPDAVLMPQKFRQEGWFTAGIDKVLHNGIDAKGRKCFFEDALSWEHFRRFDGTSAGRKGEGRNLTGGKQAWCNWMATGGTDEDQPDGQAAQEAVRLFEQGSAKPIFLGLGFNKPHDPFHAPKKYFDLYPLDAIRLAELPADRSPLLPAAMPGVDKKNSMYAQFQVFTDVDRREFRRAYYACTTFTDTQVGKVLDMLDRRKLWDDTIVVLIGDHGYHLGEHGWWNKVTNFELSARPPFIVWAPGCKGMGQPTRGIVEFIDIYPTLLDLCGIAAPAGLDGTSFRPILDDPTHPGKKAAYSQVLRSEGMGRSVRTDRWRYTEWDEGRQGVELYDHSFDPLEYHNLAAEPQNASVIAEHKKLLAEIAMPVDSSSPTGR